jgi:hypothetical protein
MGMPVAGVHIVPTQKPASATNARKKEYNLVYPWFSGRSFQMNP